MSNNLITKIEAIEIVDSREKPTLKITVFADLFEASFSVPSGASTGMSECCELRDPDGGMKNAISKIESIIQPNLIGKNVLNQKEIDQTMIELDGTLNKSNLGGNSILGISMACARLGALLRNMPLANYLKETFYIKPKNPQTYFYANLINGGKHAENNLAFQEYHIVPIVEDPKEALEIVINFQNLLKNLIQSNLEIDDIPIGDEGGFAPKLENIREPLVFLKKVITNNNLENKVRLALDVAASSFYEEGFYLVDGKKITKEELMNLYAQLINEFNIFSIEDPFEENDFESFAILKNKFPDLLVVADDLTVTNKVLLEKAIKENSINALIIKPNQIGTLTEVFETIKLAYENNIEIIVSHRSGETMDDFIADLASAFGAFGLKAGAPSKEERLVKYNRFIKITK